MPGLNSLVFFSELKYPTIFNDGTTIVSSGGTTVTFATGVPLDVKIMVWNDSDYTLKNSEVWLTPAGELKCKTLGTYYWRIYNG